MEETIKSRNQQKGNNKMLIKIGGGGGGGGIGVVVLFGGALATAAFASIFVLGQKIRSSGKDRRHNSSPEINEKSERDEDQSFHEHESEGEREETEMEKDSTVMITAHSLKEDDEKQGDDEAREVEDDAVSVDGFVIIKEEIPLLAEKDEIRLIREDVSDDFSKGSTNSEQVSIGDEINGVKVDQINDDKNVTEEREFGGFCDGNGEINEEKAVKPEAIDRGKVDFNGDGIIVSENHNADGDELLLLTAAVEMDESIVGCIAEMTVNGCIVNVTKKQNGENGESLEVDAKMNGNAQKEVLPGLETVEYGENGEAPDLGLSENGAAAVVQHPDCHDTEGHKDNEERGIEKEERLVDSQTEGHKDDIVEGEIGKEERLLGRGESNWEALWQAEWPKASPQQVKVMSYEVGGKIQEDMKGSFFEKYEVEMGTVKDHTRNSTRRRGMMIWVVCVVSSLSCSWFFDLSCAKICLLVFLTVFLLEIYGYPLVHRKRDQCLHAVKGEGSYEQRS